MKKITLFFMCLVFAGLNVLWAQNVQVSGVVTDAAGPIIGATVAVKSGNAFAVTDVNGGYAISVPTNAVLVFTMSGMITQEIPVNGRTVIDVAMTEDVRLLDEVVVLAYGNVVSKAAYTGAASTIKGEKLAKEQTSNLSKGLAGKVPGLQTFSSTGQPGSAASINIRGLGSISASTAPLIVLDGVPYEGNLNQINNQDVESMTVLKDAAAISIYGARGSNGIILITTKKGQSGKPQISFENRTGFNDRGVPAYDVMTSPKDYYELYWESIRNRRMYTQNVSAAAAGLFASQTLVSNLGNYNSYDVPSNVLVDPFTGRLNPNANLLYYDNWQEEAFTYGLRQENNVSVRGGTDKTRYFASVNYLYDQAYTVNSSFQRISGRLSLDQEVNSWFSMGMNMAMANTVSNSPNVGSTTLSSIFYTGQMIAPIFPVYRRDADGNKMYDPNTGKVLYDYGVTEGHARPFGANSNALAQQERDIRKYTTDVINAKAYATVSFLNDFKLTANASIDNFHNGSITFQTPDGGDAENVGGRGTKQHGRYYVMNINQILDWERSFGDDHTMAVKLVHETKKDNSSSLWAQRENFLIPTNPELANSAVLVDASGSSAEYALEGYLAQANYNFRSKYYFSALYRRDASSVFHPDSRWGNFYAVSAAWRVKQENFMQNISWLDDFKLRVSYGTQGNDIIGNNQPYLDQYEVVNIEGVLGLGQVFRGNKDITWEKSKTFNAGFESRLFDRLALTFEYFVKNTDDMIYHKPLPPSMGLPSSRIENSMAMRNTGIELDLNWDIIKTVDWYWNFEFNLTHYVNKLTKLPPDRPQNGWATGSYYRKIGSGAYNWYTYKYAGVNPDTGAPQYYADVTDNDGNITGTELVDDTGLATRYDLNTSAIPDIYGGFSTSVNYKGFDLSITAAYQIGGWVEDSPYSALMAGGRSGQVFHKDMYQRWTPNNVNSNIPRLEENNLNIGASSDRFLTSGTHLALRNVILGYNFPKSVLSGIGVDLLRVYVVADNLWLFSARKGFDPRQSFTGSAGYIYSAARTISLGLSINF